MLKYTFFILNYVHSCSTFPPHGSTDMYQEPRFSPAWVKASQLCRSSNREGFMSIAKRNSSTLLCGLLFALLAGALASAQTVTGTISGTVIDSSGAVIAGASATLINERTGEVRKLATSHDARFTFSAVQPGSYTIKLEAQGFQTLEQKNVVLSANEDLALGQLALKPGQVSEIVTVTESGSRVETESSDLSARLTADQINLISTKGRDVTSLLRNIPGMSYVDDIESVGSGYGTELPNVSGQRGRSTVVTVDGLMANDPSGSNLLSMTINQDAVGEVKVLRNNYAAEYGNNGGAMINIVAKGGGRQYHGSAYYFLRNEAFNANDWFRNHGTTDAVTGVWSPLPRPMYRHNTWGLNFGGPVQIPKIFPNREGKKLFFFYSYEKPHTIEPAPTRFVTVPTALERNGDFSQSYSGIDSKTGLPTKAWVRDPLIATGNCSATDQSACFKDPSRATPSNATGVNIIPQARWNASGLAILNFFPLPNMQRSDLSNYFSQKSNDVPKTSQVVRVDFAPTEKDRFYTKLQWWTADNEGNRTSGWPSDDESTWGITSHYLYKDNGLTLNWVHILSTRVVNEASVGLRHDSEGFIPSAGVVDRLSRTTLKYTAPQLYPANNSLGTIPRATNWGGVGGHPAKINWLDRWGETGNDYVLPSFTDNLTFTRGNHSYKAGIYFERVRNGEAAGGNWSGTFDFRSNSSSYTTAAGNTGFAYANALLGNFYSYNESSSRPHTNLAITLVQWYAQDQWKVNSRLSLNYGLRLGFHSQWYQRDKLASNFDPARFSPANMAVLYQPSCVGGTPPLGSSCSKSNQRALNPVNGQLSTNVNLVGTLIPGLGDPLDGMALLGDGKTPAGFKEVKPVDWEPRVGFAWDMFGKGKTVLRAMGGVYHAPRVGGGTTGGNLVNNPPFQRTLTLQYGNIDNLANLVGTALTNPSSVNAVQVHSKTPTTYNYSLGVEQDIGFKSVLEVTYVGSVSRHLGERRNLNGVPDGAKFVDVHPENRNPFSSTGVKADNFLRPYQGYGDINTVMYTGTSNYNGLQAQVTRRYTRAFQYGIAYTWSRTMDYANDDSTDVVFSRPYRQFNYGPADFDQTHILTANYIWELPSPGKRLDNGFVKAVFDNWQISGTTSIVSGKPESLSVSYSTPSGYSGPLSTDFTGGEVQAYPNMVCNPNRGGGGVNKDGLPLVINTSCFALPTGRGDIGNMRRNLLRLPGIFNSDLALFKNIPLGERGRLQFRWETYNLFNHTNFKGIDTKMTFDVTNGAQTNSRFGAVTSVRSPRVMQASLRISF
jgi:hypothetical protein